MTPQTPSALRVTPLAHALAMLAAGFAVSQATAQTPAPQRQDRIEITGSNIKRTDAEGPLPVEVITRAEIERKGVATTNDLLRSLSYMSSVNDELTANSPSTTGTAAVGFRGLAGTQTVVLLNGRRLANYGFDGDFVDLNNIPLAAIERVEVLKDGASAIYGADAIGGVVNFITRKSYRGGQVQGSLSNTSQGGSAEKTAAATFGMGDLAKDGYNLLANLSFYKRDPLSNLQRERTRTADYRRFGGSNQMNDFAPTGNFINPTTGKWQPFTACPANGVVTQPSPRSPSDAASSACLFDFAPYRSTLFGTERTGLFLNARAKLGDNEVFAEFMRAQTETPAFAAPAPRNFTLPATHPANSFGVDLNVFGRPLQAGPRTVGNESKANRFVFGTEGSWGETDYTLAVGRATNDAVNTDGGYLLTAKLLAAINNGSFNPFSTSNSAAVLDSIRSTDKRIGASTYSFFDAKVSGNAFQFGAGQVGYAIGAVVAQESIADVPGPNMISGNVFGGVRASAVNASRKLKAIYGELSVPFAKNLEGQLALRHDSYDTVSATTPKLALRYQPSKELLLRASYSQGFKMPSLRDLFGGLNESADNAKDLPGCAQAGITAENCGQTQYFRYSGGNARLESEKSKSYNLGLVFEPFRDMSFGVDYFSITKTDEIGLVAAQTVINGTRYVRGATTTLAGDAAFSVTRDSTGAIVSVNTAQGNLGERRIQGVDVSAQMRTGMLGGRLNTQVQASYFTRYDYADLPGAPLLNRAGFMNLPQWKSTVSFNWSAGAWDLSAVHTNMARMYDQTQANAGIPITATARTVGNFETWDLGMAYSGIKGLRLAGIVKNALNTEPGFANNDSRAYGFAAVHDIRGRMLQLSASYSF